MLVDQHLRETLDRAGSGDNDDFEDLLRLLRERGLDGPEGIRELARSDGMLLRRARTEDSDSDVQTECAASLERHMELLGGYPPELPRLTFALTREANTRVGRVRAGLCPRLAAWLQERVDTDVDAEELKKFGT